MFNILLCVVSLKHSPVFCLKLTILFIHNPILEGIKILYGPFWGMQGDFEMGHALISFAFWTGIMRP